MLPHGRVSARPLYVHDADHYLHFVKFLLECINNIVQYQAPRNQVQNIQTSESLLLTPAVIAAAHPAIVS